ncbi:MAG: NAD-dependent epimerase/dehydratase family protein [Chlorobi bacterium]|nr:NAD-dependent epimerase/dehydratase family protein [Chlorobiota bacterium]
MARILITGGAGFIGSSLAEALVADQSNFVIIVDNLLTGKLENLPSPDLNNWVFEQVDVNDFKSIEKIFNKYEPEYVFHFAAVVGVERTLNNPLMVLEDIEGSKNIAKLSVSHKVKRIFFASSSEVYGNPFEVPQKEETTPINARLPYAAVKNISEVILKTYGQEFGLPYTIFRFFNTYGPRQSSDFVISRFIKQALSGKPITVHGPGTQTRTFCFISDTVETILKILYNDLRLNTTINIGNNEEVSMLKLAEMTKAITGSKSRIEIIPPREEGEILRRKPDISKMLSILRRPLVKLEDGIAAIVKVWTEHRGKGIPAFPQSPYKLFNSVYLSHIK